MYRPPNRAIHHCDLINIRISFALCELSFFFFFSLSLFSNVFLFHGLFFVLNLHTETKAQMDCLNLFSVMLLRWNIHFCYCCCCSLQSDSTPREIQKQEFKHKQLMNEHDPNMQMQLKFRSFPPNVVFNLLFIFALDIHIQQQNRLSLRFRLLVQFLIFVFGSDHVSRQCTLYILSK